MCSHFSHGPTAMDCGIVSELALNVYRACKTSGQEFQNMADDIASVHIILQDIKDGLTVDSTGLSHTSANSLKEKLESAHTELKHLEIELQSYNRLSISTQRKFDALRYGLETAGDAHMQIKCITTALQTIEHNLAL
jgi:hypothetical protein